MLIKQALTWKIQTYFLVKIIARKSQICLCRKLKSELFCAYTGVEMTAGCGQNPTENFPARKKSFYNTKVGQKLLKHLNFSSLIS